MNNTQNDQLISEQTKNLQEENQRMKNELTFFKQQNHLKTKLIDNLRKQIFNYKDMHKKDLIQLKKLDIQLSDNIENFKKFQNDYDNKHLSHFYSLELIKYYQKILDINVDIQKKYLMQHKAKDNDDFAEHTKIMEKVLQENLEAKYLYHGSIENQLVKIVNLSSPYSNPLEVLKLIYNSELSFYKNITSTLNVNIKRFGNIEIDKDKNQQKLVEMIKKESDQLFREVDPKFEKRPINSFNSVSCKDKTAKSQKMDIENEVQEKYYYTPKGVKYYESEKLERVDVEKLRNDLIEFYNTKF